MDVFLLSRLLKELIIDNERIPIPGIGYFQTEPMPAHFSEDGKTIYPPSKRISFKGDDRATGDMVALYYSAGTGIDERTAVTELEAFLKQLKITLLERKNIEFPGLGRLRCTLEGNPYFIAEQDGGIFSQAFGFEPVILKPVRTAPTAEATAPAHPESPTTEPEPEIQQTPEAEAGTDAAENRGKRKGLRILYIVLAVLAALIIATVVLLELGRSGKLNRLIYSEEELELIEQQGL